MYRFPSEEALIVQSLFKIVDKSGELVPFILNEAQAQYDQDRTSRDIILKARQLGFSSYIDAIITAECLSKRNLRCILIAHDNTSTEKMFDRVRSFINNLPGGLKPDMTRSNRREFYFRKQQSAFYIGTAGYEEFGRGDTIHRLHASELASWPNPKKVAAGLFRAVPRDGHIYIESTAKGQGNWFHNRCLTAMSGQGRYTLHFFPWFHDPNYVDDTQLSYAQLDEEEQSLYTHLSAHWRAEWGSGWLIHPFVMRQLAWRRSELADMDDSETVHGSNLFPQEYPATPHEAFVASGHGVFGQIPNHICDPLSRSRFIQTWELPRPNTKYVLGVDVAAGVGSDRSVIWGLNCNDLTQAFEWVSDAVDPVELATYVAELAASYNDAWVVPELNNHGLATIEALRKLYTPSRILQRYMYDNRKSVKKTGRLGWLTTQRTKSQMISYLRQALAKGLVVRSMSSVGELSTFVEHENGSIGATQGTYDDRVIAMALAVAGFQHTFVVPLKAQQVVEASEFSFRRARKDYIAGYIEQHGRKPGSQYVDTGFIH